MLKDTDTWVTQIAHRVGFVSTESMPRHFLIRLGTTPRAYRDTFRGTTNA